MKIVLLSLATMLLLSAALVSANQTIQWTFDAARGRYPDVVLKQGESINFVWMGDEGTHDVNIHTANNWDTTGTVEVQANAMGPVTFSYKLENAGDVYFACDVGPHCSVGGILLRARVCGLFNRFIDGVIAFFTLFIVRGECLLF